jgi:hypothetical protein
MEPSWITYGPASAFVFSHRGDLLAVSTKRTAVLHDADSGRTTQVFAHGYSRTGPGSGTFASVPMTDSS